MWFSLLWTAARIESILKELRANGLAGSSSSSGSVHSKGSSRVLIPCGCGSVGRVEVYPVLRRSRRLWVLMRSHTITGLCTGAYRWWTVLDCSD